MKKQTSLRILDYAFKLIECHQQLGKSTIAKYLHNLSLEESQRNLDFKDCTQNGYDDSIHQILTFDENFTRINHR